MNPSPPDAEAIIGMAWLYALHARSCIARRKLWQAEYMISGIRDNALALACLRTAFPQSTVEAWIFCRTKWPRNSSLRSFAI
jgi:hypothetical protein